MQRSASTAWLPAELEPASCAACGSAAPRRTLTRGDGMRVAVCACGLGYLSPRPKPEHIARLYTGGYFQGAIEGVGYATYILDSKALAADPRGVHNVMAEALDRRTSLRGRRLLDVGAATGVMLAVARERGAEVLGIEPSGEVARAGQEIFGVEIRPGYLGEVELPPESFDVVTMLEVIEHPVAPRELLRAARRVLRPGGTLALSTPNFGMVRWWGARYPGFFASYEHLHYWTEGALRRVLSEEGFDSVAFEGWNLRFVQEHPGEPRPRALVRRALRPILGRLPRDVVATGLLAFARRA